MSRDGATALQPGQQSKNPSQKHISWAWWCTPIAQLLERLRPENCLNPRGGCCSKPRLYHCTSAWATERDPVSINQSSNQSINQLISDELESSINKITQKLEENINISIILAWFCKSFLIRH